MISLGLTYFGDRNYIDIAQIGYRCLYPFFQEDYLNCKDFYLRIHKAVTPYSVLIEKSEFESKYKNKYEIAAKINFKKPNEQLFYGYVCNPIENMCSQNLLVHLPRIKEPIYTEGQHYELLSNEVRILAPIQTEWPVFFALMLLGRFSGQHFYGSTKPMGVSFDSKYFPKTNELTKMRAIPLHAPIHNLARIAICVDDNMVGTSLVRI